eukprot:TRINITY_DN2986_c0_g1_i1.p1 TRINITY_DN2986_c0_g1~~TRINITY_DN2986_c0_g1_i1.p1  ORF type:complete len:231 (-),score=27.22 TRINITY_DN2986_c0_g1_i1:222-914(-)
MILAANYSRQNGVPYLGICLGMQIAVVEFARSVLGRKDANSSEFDASTLSPCVVYMPEVSKTHMGGTMRLGSRRTYFETRDCITAKLYRKETYVDERHRHRYEVNPDMVEELESAGLRFVGKDETGRRMEILELPDHPFYVGVQFHPEFKSRPDSPSAVFRGLILASIGELESYLSGHGNGKMSYLNGGFESSKISVAQNLAGKVVEDRPKRGLEQPYPYPASRKLESRE